MMLPMGKPILACGNLPVKNKRYHCVSFCDDITVVEFECDACVKSSNARVKSSLDAVNKPPLCVSRNLKNSLFLPQPVSTFFDRYLAQETEKKNILSLAKDPVRKYSRKCSLSLPPTSPDKLSKALKLELFKKKLSEDKDDILSMTSKEKQWLASIQIHQLVEMQSTDYYFKKYMAKKQPGQILLEPADYLKEMKKLNDVKSEDSLQKVKAAMTADLKSENNVKKVKAAMTADLKSEDDVKVTMSPDLKSEDSVKRVKTADAKSDVGSPDPLIELKTATVTTSHVTKATGTEWSPAKIDLKSCLGKIPMFTVAHARQVLEEHVIPLPPSTGRADPLLTIEHYYDLLFQLQEETEPLAREKLVQKLLYVEHMPQLMNIRKGQKLYLKLYYEIKQDDRFIFWWTIFHSLRSFFKLNKSTRPLNCFLILFRYWLMGNKSLANVTVLVATIEDILSFVLANNFGVSVISLLIICCTNVKVILNSKEEDRVMWATFLSRLMQTIKNHPHVEMPLLGSRKHMIQFLKSITPFGTDYYRL